MDPKKLRYVELVNMDDDLLLPWLDLYETVFPPSERLLVSNQLQFLKRRAAGDGKDNHMVAALDAQGCLTGLLQYSIGPEASVAFLWYFAVQPTERGKGLGAEMYGELWNRLDAAACRALVFEVEIPEETESDEQRRLAERRITFYRRLGARLLRGVSHMQYVGWHQAPIPMHVMVHSREPLVAQVAYDIAKAVLEDSISQVAHLSLE